MAEEKQQDGQKTIVAFIVGLLIGGILVWAFSGPSTPVSDNETDAEETETIDDESNDTEGNSDATETETAPVAVLQVGEGDVTVANQPASNRIALESATYPVSEGWIGVREFNNEQLGYILGVVRFSESQGLVPNEILLQRSTTPGREYAVVIYTEDGDRSFNLANDVQIDTVFDTFTAE